MVQKSILWILALTIIAGGWLLYSSKASAPTIPENTETPAQEAIGTEVGAEGVAASQAVPDGEANGNVTEMIVTNVPDVVISYTDTGFVPSAVTIKKGQIVQWVNDSGAKVWPASAVHPSHSVYPQKSSSDCLGSSFDACKGLSQGETWDFKFDYAGEWKFHDHLKASQSGSVTVTE